MIKRIFDIVFSLVVIAVVLVWMVPVVAIVILITTGERPFYRQERVGKNGLLFQIYKFRSMKGVPPVNDPLLSDEESFRITHFGKFIRKYRIDEFPQFVNVLLGQMSIVGPRPERQFFLDSIMEHVPRYRVLQNLRPGITSLGQIRYGYADSIDQMKLRARYDLVYIDNVSLLTDIKIILYTIIVVVKGKGK